jgi:hypothetical protein
MRQKKSNFVYYVAASLIVAAMAFVILHEAPIKQERIEEVIK